MLLGALVGFLVGAVIGITGNGLSSPVIAPFVGALCGVAAAGIPFLVAGARHHRAEVELWEARHEELRHAAHDGWIDGVELTDARSPR